MFSEGFFANKILYFINKEVFSASIWSWA